VRFVVAYDINDDRKRRKIQKYIAGFSDDFQKSVYEVELNKSELKELYKFLDKVSGEEDKFLIFPLKKGYSFGKSGEVEFIV